MLRLFRATPPAETPDGLGRSFESQPEGGKHIESQTHPGPPQRYGTKPRSTPTALSGIHEGAGAKFIGEFSILVDDTLMPSGSMITTTDRRLCRSIPT